MINVFTVEPANQRRLVELLTETRGFSPSGPQALFSASLHRSADGTKVAMYAQWESIEHYQAKRQDPTPLQILQ